MLKFKEFLTEELTDELSAEQLKQFPVLLRYRVSFAKSHNQVYDASRLKPTLYNYNKLLGFLRSKADVTTGKAIPSAITLYNKIMGIDTGIKATQQSTIEFAGKLDNLKNKEKIIDNLKKLNLNPKVYSDKNLKTTIKIIAQVVNKENPQQQLVIDDFLKNLEDEEFVKKYIEEIQKRVKELEQEYKEKIENEKESYENALKQIEQKRNETHEKVKLKNLDKVEDKVHKKHEKTQEKLDAAKKDMQSFRDFLSKK